MEILANGAFSIEGIPVERNDKTGMAMLLEWFLLEQKPRVQQPPKCEEHWRARRWRAKST